ncbi:MAG: N-acetylglucosamine-6-phosphate deacetylase [Candidatus Aminicenantales bacterium]
MKYPKKHRPIKQRGRPRVPDTLIRAGLVLTPDHEIHKGSILIHGRRIIAVGRAAEIDAAVRRRHDRSGRFEMDVIDAADLVAVPGFIDLHQHGGGGSDYMDGTPDAIRKILRFHGGSGTTSVVPTLMTGSRPALRKALAALDAVRPRRTRGSVSAAEPVEPEILGVHLEGPFISKEMHGAQPASAIRKIDEAEIREYLKSFRTPIRIVTLAPELSGAPAFIKFLVRRGIVAAAGHSNADFDQAIRGFDAGITHGTHLFNAMRGFAHREPGLAGALLLNERASVELIADGRHLHPAAIFLVIQAKPEDKVVLVTDATRHAGTGEEPLRTAEGGLFGSNLNLFQAVRNIMKWSGWSLQEVLPLATSNPARVLGLEKRKGTIRAGADADILLLDHKLNVRGVWYAGRRLGLPGAS